MTLSIVKRTKPLTQEIERLKRERLRELRAEIAGATELIYRRTAEYFWRLGEYFQEIRKNRLWLADDGWAGGADASFERWCHERTGWSAAWAERLVRFRRAYDAAELREVPRLGLSGYLALEQAFAGLPAAARKPARARALKQLAQVQKPTTGEARKAAVRVRAELEAVPERQVSIPQCRAPVGPAVAADLVALQVLIEPQGDLPYLDARTGRPRPLTEGCLLNLPLPGTPYTLAFHLGPLGAHWWVAVR